MKPEWLIPLGSYATRLHDEMEELVMLGDLLTMANDQIPFEKEVVYRIGSVRHRDVIFVRLADSWLC